MTILRDIAIRYQFLDSEVQSTISTRSRLLSPFSFDEQEIQPNIIRKANQLRSLMFGNVQLFDLLKIPGGTAHFDSLLKAKKTKEPSEFFNYEWWMDQPPQQIESHRFPILWKLLQKSTTFQQQRNEKKSNWTKVELSKIPRTGGENYQVFRKCGKNCRLSETFSSGTITKTLSRF